MKLQTFKLTIGTKLIGLIAALLLGSIVSLVWISTRMFIDDNTTLIQTANADMAANVATQMRELLDGLNERTRVLATALLNEFKSPGAKDKVVGQFFAKDKDILAVYVQERSGNGQMALRMKAISPEAAKINDSDGMLILNAVRNSPTFNIQQVFQGEIGIDSTKLPDGKQAIAIGLPYIQQGPSFSHIILVVLRQDRVTKAMSASDLITSFLVDRSGKILAHPTAADVVGTNASHLEIVRLLLSGKSNNAQTRYYDDQSKEFRLGAFRIVGFGGLGVVSDVPEAKAFEAARRVQYRSMLIAFSILCIAFLAGYLYSGSITTPIKALVHAAHRISEGDFKINLVSKSKDELAQLSTAFNEMAKGLEERDKVKETFNKFHSKEIAEKLLSGEVKLGGERKDATVFFSDVRGFTALSESMKPEEVVEMLNEYMTRMVRVILKNGGVVDKYVGDAIMALWGVPLTKGGEMRNALMACLEMRQELASLNELRISRGQGPLKIGMGLNHGQVVAGNIGSSEKMEYTVIGDTVNTASRVESMTKEFGTDLLVPKDFQEALKDEFIFEECEAIKVKGKADALVIFKVRGYRVNGKDVIIETPYSSYGKEKSDKASH